ncbi:hypothetical protein [Clostridium aminobutyricum]|uniref:Uncharacterized protein n=1 Tax=Clostridium aminobutyricum TaxID=33953 RepID=A0A939IKC4_CLOAM|nr:hypothetical protein [Clostridium aminobutyricum]MBN7774464.1 hypothetical protein [Clostridium aminobutyricum]
MDIKEFSIKNKKIVFIVFGLFLCFSLYYFGVYNSISDVTIASSYKSYDDISSLDKGAELIVIGSTAQDFEDREHKATFFDDGTLEDFYSLTNIKVNKVLKGADGIKNGDNLNIIEPASIIQTVEGKQRLLRDDYQPLEKNKNYILFLKKNDNGQYSIINMNLGKLDLADKDKKFKMKNKDDKLMKDAFEKYLTESDDAIQSYDETSETDTQQN